AACCRSLTCALPPRKTDSICFMTKAHVFETILISKHLTSGKQKRPSKSHRHLGDKGMDSKWQLVLGRVLLSAIFILSGLGKLPHFHDVAGMMASKGIPVASVALVI